METKLQQWAREETKQVRIRADLHTYLKEEAERTGKSIYYLTNQAIIKAYERTFM